MNFNLFDLMTKWNQFQNLLKQSENRPEELLEQELKKRNINANQLNEMIQQAKALQSLFRSK